MAKLAATKYSEAIFELAVQEGRVDEFYNEAGVILSAQKMMRFQSF